MNRIDKAQSKVLDPHRAPPSARSIPDLARPKRDSLSVRLRRRIESALKELPWTVQITDWASEQYRVGRGSPHWRGRALEVELRTPEAGRRLLRGDGMGFLESFLDGEVELEGNLYLLAEIRRYADIKMGLGQFLSMLLHHEWFQTPERARSNVKNHYDIPQDALDIYLDREYKSYSCGMFEHPERLDVEELLRVGEGQRDGFDSLEKAQWRKFQDAVDYVATTPVDGETLLDVGCGYGGQLSIALDSQPFERVVGWTHSRNQALDARRRLARFDSDRWEVHEGDYRLEQRTFDHITSTGMISHVGPRGLVPYVRNIRGRIRDGGRYLHHALMIAYSRLPHDYNVGLAFNKKYVWPGFHWFTLAEHVTALERNGFEIERVVNLSAHYAKTTAAWYERMMGRREEMVALVGEPTTRAWQIFLAGIAGSFLNSNVHVYRLYCRAL